MMMTSDYWMEAMEPVNLFPDCDCGSVNAKNKIRDGL